MKIMITGAGGQLGQDCQKALSHHELFCLSRSELDIADAAAVSAAVAAVRPDALVNCAAYTKVDAAESDTANCRRGNTIGPMVLSQACSAAGARLIHISTDYVFDGSLPPPAAYHEEHPARPLGVYGASKLAGEKHVLAFPRGTVVRTAWLYGDKGPNFLLSILQRALQAPGSPLRVVDDQHGAPTWSLRLAQQIAVILDAGAPDGLYHATAHGAATWYQVATAFFSLLELDHKIEPIPTSAYPTPARRPANSRLENRKLGALGLDIMAAWREELEIFTAQHGRLWLLNATKPGLDSRPATGGQLK